MTTTLILGGARSGKSAHAEALAKASALPVTYIATAQVYDAEFATRIQQHQQRRPAEWRLVEAPHFLAETLRQHASPDACIIVDCLTVWLAQWICADCEPPASSSWEAEQAALLAALQPLPGQLILVSNEVGMGIVPLGAINRQFQDLQGRLNQAVAARCEQVFFMAAGLPLTLKSAG